MGERVLYDDLRKGRKGYVCDKTLMANITKDDTDEQAKMKLVGVITSIFKNSGIVIRSLYIGKSYLDKKGTTTSDEEDNDNSFDDKQLKGVKSRWHHHAKQYYGKRGLIVIEIITADKVPNEKQGHERHCLDLEEKLIEYYQNQINPALKIANPKKYSEGKKAKKDYKASVLYIAFNTSTIHWNTAIEMTKRYSFDESRLAVKIYDILEKAKEEAGANVIIKEFHIGITDVNIKNSEIWYTNKIEQEWNKLSNGEDKKIDEMIVLTVVFKDDVPDGISTANEDYPHKDYALALKQALVARFKFELKDERCKSQITGEDNCKELNGGYAIYLTIKYKVKQ